jgi:hypothetical protein
MVQFTPPPIPTAPSTGMSKDSAFIAKCEDKRPAGTEIFVFSNPPHTWTYKSKETVEDIVHKLLKEALQRRGISETTNNAAARQVRAEILDFSGHNDRGVFYVGKCIFDIRCMITVKNPAGDKSFIATGSGTNGIASLSDENMNVLMKRAYEAFLKNIERELQKAGF